MAGTPRTSLGGVSDSVALVLPAGQNVRFVKTISSARSLEGKALARARRLAGLKCYVTNIPVTIWPAGEVISCYHDLWRVEQTFRMSKIDLRARPMFHRWKDAIGSAPDHRLHRADTPAGPAAHLSRDREHRQNSSDRYAQRPFGGLGISGSGTS